MLNLKNKVLNYIKMGPSFLEERVGPVVAMNLFNEEKMTALDLVLFGVLDEDMAFFQLEIIVNRANSLDLKELKEFLNDFVDKVEEQHIYQIIDFFNNRTNVVPEKKNQLLISLARFLEEYSKEKFTQEQQLGFLQKINKVVEKNSFKLKRRKR